MSDTLVVRPHNPYLRNRIILSVVLLALAAFAIGYFSGEGHKAFTDQRVSDLKGQVDELAQAAAKQREQINALSVTAEFDRSALELARREIGELQTTLAEQGAELELYRGLASDGDVPNGISVRRFRLFKTDDPQTFRYRWTIRQKATNMKNVTVLADLVVHTSTLNGSEAVSFADLDGNIEAMPLSLKFKYFKISEGVLVLPEGLSPTEVEITIRQSAKGSPVFQQKYPWSVEVQ